LLKKQTRMKHGSKLTTSQRTPELNLDGVDASRLRPTPRVERTQRIEQQPPKDLAPKQEEEIIPLEKDPTAVVFKGPGRPKNFTVSPEPEKQKEPENMNTTSTAPRAPINARQNIERQQREQRTVSTLLGGAAATVIIVIVSVAGLAAFGGYVLWKQIQEQSVTVNLLEANTKQGFAQLRDEMEQADQRLLKQEEAANLKLVNLSSQVDEQRATTKRVTSMVETQQAVIKQHTAQINQMGSELDRSRTRSR
jgi:hypothetical protein